MTLVMFLNPPAYANRFPRGLFGPHLHEALAPSGVEMNMMSLGCFGRESMTTGCFLFICIFCPGNGRRSVS